MPESLVFFGSGPVAAKSLEFLAQDFEVEAVVTKPSTLAEMTKSAQGARLYPVNTAAELDELIAAKPFQSRVGVLIDFGIIVSKTVINYFPLGIANSHFSLLPKWRGPDPITFSILNGDEITGVSLMLINEALDEGLLLAQSPFTLPPNVTTPELSQSLIEVSHSMLRTMLPRYVAGELQPFPQDYEQAPTYSRKLTKEDGIIDWHKPAEQIEREIRAFIEWPKSRTIIAGKDVIITEAHAVPSNDSEAKPGDIDIANGTILMVECSNGYLCIEKLKPAGKREMTPAEFIRGYLKK